MKFWTRWRAKRALLHKYEFEAALTEWNAELSLDRGREKRKLIAKLNAEADVKPRPNIRIWLARRKYEADREKNEAKKIVADRRAQAKGLEGDIENHESTAKLLQRQAAGNRETAERLRKL